MFDYNYNRIKTSFYDTIIYFDCCGRSKRSSRTFSYARKRARTDLLIFFDAWPCVLDGGRKIEIRTAWTIDCAAVSEPEPLSRSCPVRPVVVLFFGDSVRLRRRRRRSTWIFEKGVYTHVLLLCDIIVRPRVFTYGVHTPSTVNCKIKKEETRVFLCWVWNEKINSRRRISFEQTFDAPPLYKFCVCVCPYRTSDFFLNTGVFWRFVLDNDACLEFYLISVQWTVYILHNDRKTKILEERGWTFSIVIYLYGWV